MNMIRPHQHRQLGLYSYRLIFIEFKNKNKKIS